ncbi:unnamed protein product [Cuscuta epithymum]|uniref:Leucine-rich repeat-containing N-terminal plant-type domain-containing protein n=1 Tax=Cuscuta epithymum TaxID=186058 RepID=A0AAV0F2F6_9ASTE|nr:unnamed protein product [Cuscuta epithymum]
MGMGRFLLLLWSSTVAVDVSCCLLLAMSGAAAAASIPKCIDGEREVLLKFKNTVLDKLDRLSSWGNHTEDCCRDWEGVGCDQATGNVIHIHLSDMSLSAKGGGGKYSTSLSFFELRYLKHLELSYNPDLLTNQSISSLIGNNTVVYLQYLNLTQTGIVGTIPGNLGNTMPALKYLDLAFNSLEGNIPDTLGNMVNLTSLDLASNQLEGRIPEALGNISVLEHLGLGANRLEGEIPPFGTYALCNT